MKSLISVLITFTVLHCATVAADAASEKQAALLLEGMQMETLLQQSIDQMLTAQIQQNPGLQPFREIMINFLNKHMSYESLKPELIRVYSEAFTANELQEINAFYQTPIGKKAIQKMPELMAQGGQIGAQRVQDNIQELQESIQAEVMRLEAQNAAPASN